MKVSVVLTIAIVAGCGGIPVKPAPPNLDTVGPLAGVSEGAESITYTLADGTVWAQPRDQFRILYDMPSGPTLFVAGTDRHGRYVLLIGGQDGLPDECTYALRYGGTEWGDSIESQGLLWAKAKGFAPLPDGPTSGGEYPGNAGFCLDDHGAVTSVYLATPTDEDSGPAPSAEG
jgi:hypothetical protein